MKKPKKPRRVVLGEGYLLSIGLDWKHPTEIALCHEATGTRFRQLKVPDEWARANSVPKIRLVAEIL